MTDPVLHLNGVSRCFGDKFAVDELSLDVAPGEFFALLGPSGCGKTTTLRMIAGLESPDRGEIRIEGKPMRDTPPYRRPVGLVFQHYALFPHLDVFDNVAFGLVERRVASSEIRRRVDEALQLVRLDPAEYRSRRPDQLSGGQRQRAALARALVLQPRILLLDEPLGALDLQLRKAMQLELRQLNRELGITFILVTHDQQEAMAMCDRIAVMHQGRLLQLGTPAEIYMSPANAFVARFIGDANILVGECGAIDNGTGVFTSNGESWRAPAHDGGIGGQAEFALRPEWLRLSKSPDEAANQMAGVIEAVVFLGEREHVLVRTACGVLRVAVDSAATTSHAPGDSVYVTWTIGREVRLGS